jgi:hypothetical protein
LLAAFESDKTELLLKGKGDGSAGCVAQAVLAPYALSLFTAFRTGSFRWLLNEPSEVGAVVGVAPRWMLVAQAGTNREAGPESSLLTGHSSSTHFHR